MKQVNYTIDGQRQLTDEVYEICLAGDTSAITTPGQFVNLRLEGLYLRRPLAVCDVVDGHLVLIYKIIGRGTDAMTHMQHGDKLDLLVGLGNGYNVNACGDHPLLIGGGVGGPSLYWLACKLLEMGKHVTVILGFASKDKIFYEDEFRRLGTDVLITTDDGTAGIKGFVADAIPEAGDYDYIYACGPEMMLRDIYNATTVDGEYSFAGRMGCGFGACRGCSVKTKNGIKRICKEGPVLTRGEIIW